MILTCIYNLGQNKAAILWFLLFVLALVQILWNNTSYQHFTSHNNRAKDINLQIFLSTPSFNKIFVNDAKPFARFKIKKLTDTPTNLRNKTPVLTTVQSSLRTNQSVMKADLTPQECEKNNKTCTELKKKQLSDVDKRQLSSGEKKKQPSEFDDEILKFFSLQENDTRDSFINLHRYGYHLDSNLCTGDPDVIIIVHSKFDHFDLRADIRRTWASNRTYLGKTFVTIFFLGEPKTRYTKPASGKKKGSRVEEQKAKVEATMSRIYLEASLYGDIVLGNFTDSYRNLTIKHIMAFNWVVSHCPRAGFVAKVDDDVMVNTYGVAKYVAEVGAKRKGLLVCRVPRVKGAIRAKRSKWFVSESEYPFPAYPAWCLGFGMLMTRDVTQTLLQTSREVRSFWIDDVYVTGILRSRAGIKAEHMRANPPRSARKDLFILRNYLGNETYMSFWKKLVDSN